MSRKACLKASICCSRWRSFLFPARYPACFRVDGQGELRQTPGIPGENGIGLAGFEPTTSCTPSTFTAWTNSIGSYYLPSTYDEHQGLSRVAIYIKILQRIAVLSIPNSVQIQYRMILAIHADRYLDHSIRRGITRLSSGDLEFAESHAIVQQADA